jgi:hypothetical protein
MLKKKTSASARDYWVSVKSVRVEVSSWPAWKRDYPVSRYSSRLVVRQEDRRSDPAVPIDESEG